MQKRDVASGEAKVFKRIMFTLTFAAAFGAAGLFLTDKAEARWGWNRPYVSYYYGPRTFYGYDVPYRTTYYRGYGYAPRYYVSQPYYSAYYDDPGYYYYRPVPRVAVRVGPYWR